MLSASKKKNRDTSSIRDDIFHKMRSPITSIIGYADMLALELKKINPDHKGTKWADNIKRAALNLNEMITELRNIEKREGD